MICVDGGKPAPIEGFTKKTVTVMVKDVRVAAISACLTTIAEFDRGGADLYRTAEPDGVFCYTFFKAVATKDAMLSSTRRS